MRGTGDEFHSTQHYVAIAISFSGLSIEQDGKGVNLEGMVIFQSKTQATQWMSSALLESQSDSLVFAPESGVEFGKGVHQV